MSDLATAPLRVLMLPDARRANPYQQLLADAVTAAGAEVHFPSGYRRGLPVWRAIADCQPLKIDIVHLHWPNPFLRLRTPFGQWVYAQKFLADLALTRQFQGPRLVWTVHNQLSHESLSASQELRFRQRLARMADRLILHNQAAAGAIAADYGFAPEEASIIPHGHYRVVYAPAIPQVAAREKLGLPATGRVYLCLGQLRPYKGVEALLQVWRECADRLFPEDTLLVAGNASSEYAATLRTLAADLPHVQLDLRFIPDGELHLYFSAATVAVFPFQRVLNSGSTILAMSYGVPIIAPRLGAIPEVVGSADALLYEPENPDGLQKALATSTQLDLHALASETERACDRLDWGAIGKQTVAAYRQAWERHA